MDTDRIYKALHLFSGIGGGALGFQQAREEFGGRMGRFETLAGIDVDAQACEDFRRLTGATAVEMDLFSREDYRAFHGHEPTADWREATAYDIWRATDGETPDVVFLSAPCKGFSGLLPQQCAAGDKYQALNRLAVRGLRLTIQTRGNALLTEIRAMLTRVGSQPVTRMPSAGA
ncbi:MAG: DNA cytosine methyltransferase [Bacilli bacterium]